MSDNLPDYTKQRHDEDVQRVEQDINYQRLLKMYPDADKTLILTEFCAFLLFQREQRARIWNAVLDELPDEYRQQVEAIQHRIVYTIPDKGILETLRDEGRIK